MAATTFLTYRIYPYNTPHEGTTAPQYSELGLLVVHIRGVLLSCHTELKRFGNGEDWSSVENIDDGQNQTR